VESVNYNVVNKDGKQIGKVELDARVFGAPAQPHLVQEVVRWQLNSRRSGSHSTLHRGDIKGGKKKPYKQKGTGRARAGSTVSPLMVGGAQVHGPKPRDYSFRMPRRVRLQALCSALSSKVTDQTLVVLDKCDWSTGKTKDAAKVSGALGMKCCDKALWLVGEGEDNLTRSVRNLANAKTLELSAVNVYDVLRNGKLIVSQKTLKTLEQELVKRGERLRSRGDVENREALKKGAAK
jgi:large subunit ribosomal protein L4